MASESKIKTVKITGTPSLLDVGFKEIIEYRFLLFMLIRRDLLTQYSQTILGPLWYIFSPTFSAIIFTIVFGKIANIPTEGVPQVLFYLSGIVLWGYFTACFFKSSDILFMNAALFSKIYFPRAVVPIAGIISNLIPAAIQFCVLLIFMAYFWFQGAIVIHPLLIVLCPLFFLIIAVFTLGVGLIVSSLTAKFRDLAQVIAYFVTLLMYATPIVYPLSRIPEKFYSFYLLNPLVPIFEGFRYCLFKSNNFQFQDLISTISVSLLLLAVGIIVFHRVERDYIDTI